MFFVTFGTLLGDVLIVLLNELPIKSYLIDFSYCSRDCLPEAGANSGSGVARG